MPGVGGGRACKSSTPRAAARLGVSRAELEAMIAAGKLEALLAGFTWMIPTHEVERLKCGQLASFRQKLVLQALKQLRPSREVAGKCV